MTTTRTHARASTLQRKLSGRRICGSLNRSRRCGLTNWILDRRKRSSSLDCYLLLLCYADHVLLSMQSNTGDPWYGDGSYCALDFGIWARAMAMLGATHVLESWYGSCD